MKLATLLVISLVVPNVLSESTAAEPYRGLLLGEFQNKIEGISAKLYAVDHSTVAIVDFIAQGQDEAMFLYVGTLNEDGGYTKTGYPLTNLKGVVRPLPSSTTGSTLVFQFPDKKRIFDIDWIGIISRKKKILYSRILISERMKEAIPSPLDLGGFHGRNGLHSSSVIILDSRNLLITNFTFKALAPDTQFWAGTGSAPRSQGISIPDETGSTNGLRRYLDETIVLTLPPNVDIFNFDWISIWSKGLERSLAHVLVPSFYELNVPPAMEDLGVQAEAALNCEKLSSIPDVDLELRWSITDDENIIIQLVSSTGSDRYLALGIKSPAKYSPVGGDVIVGWINSRTGKGGVDDYFLAGDSETCEDGAESCPDSSKPEGKKDVKILSSISRDNYTMLTFQRSIGAQDFFDVPIYLDRPQNVFWSIGYKSPDLRRSNRPLKNPDPILIDFGRPTTWNCPTNTAEESVGDADPIAETTTTTASTTTTIRTTTWPIYPEITTTPLRHLRRPTTQMPEIHNNLVRRKIEISADDQLIQEPVDKSWWVPSISCHDAAQGPLFLQLGPAAMHRGNQGLGVEGVAFYVNGLLAPDIYLERGVNYTFVVETGLGRSESQQFHPMYITTDSAGGYQTKSEYEKMVETAFAGIRFDRDGNPVPSGFGRLCQWLSTRPSDTFASYSDFHDNLNLDCPEMGPEDEPGVFSFTPNNGMPDDIYYQSFTAKHVGGVIHLVNECQPKRFQTTRLTTFRPKLESYLSKEEKGPAPDDVSLLQSLLKTRNDRLKTTIEEPNRKVSRPSLDIKRNISPYLFGSTRPSGESYKDKVEAQLRRQKCLQRKEGQQSKFKANSEMPRFEHFPMRDISYGRGSGDPDCDQVDETNEIKDYDITGQLEAPRVKQRPIMKTKNNEFYNMAPFEEVTTEPKPPAWQKFWKKTAITTTVTPVQQHYDNTVIDVPSNSIDIVKLNSIKLPDVPRVQPEVTFYRPKSLPKADTVELVPRGKPKLQHAPTPASLPPRPLQQSPLVKNEYPLRHQVDPTQLNNGYLFDPEYRRKSYFQHQQSKNELLEEEDTSRNTIHDQSRPHKEVQQQQRPQRPIKQKSPVRPNQRRPPRPRHRHQRPSHQQIIHEQDPVTRPHKEQSYPSSFLSLRNPFSNLMSPLTNWFQKQQQPRPSPQQQQQHQRRPRPRPKKDRLSPPGNFPTFKRPNENFKREKRPKKGLIKGQNYIDDSFASEHQFQGRPNRFFNHQQPSIGHMVALQRDHRRPRFPGPRDSYEIQIQSPSETSEQQVKPDEPIAQVTQILSDITTLKPIHVPESKPYTLSNLSPALIKQPHLLQASTSSGDNEVFVASDKLAVVPSQSVGFNPTLIEPESGFVPMGSSGGPSVVPPLAFNVLEESDLQEQVPYAVSPESADAMSNRRFQSGQLDLTGDRGGDLAIPVPAPVVPHVSQVANTDSQMAEEALDSWPNAYLINQEMANQDERLPFFTDDPEGPIAEAKTPAEADFQDFYSVEQNEKPVLNLEPYQETDRIDLPNEPLIMDFQVGASMGQTKGQSGGEKGGQAQRPFKIAVGSVGQPEPAYSPLDPHTVTFTKNSEPYGQQFPSYVAGSMQTTLGTSSDHVKSFSTSDDVVYGTQSADSGDQSLYRLKQRLGLEELEDEDMLTLIEKIHGRAAA